MGYGHRLAAKRRIQADSKWEAPEPVMEGEDIVSSYMKV